MTSIKIKFLKNFTWQNLTQTQFSEQINASSRQTNLRVFQPLRQLSTLSPVFLTTRSFASSFEIADFRWRFKLGKANKTLEWCTINSVEYKIWIINPVTNKGPTMLLKKAANNCGVHICSCVKGGHSSGWSEVWWGCNFHALTNSQFACLRDKGW